MTGNIGHNTLENGAKSGLVVALKIGTKSCCLSLRLQFCQLLFNQEGYVSLNDNEE